MAQVQRLDLGDGLVARRDADGVFSVEALPRAREGWRSFAERLCGSVERDGEIRDYSGRRRLLAGIRYRVPWDCLVPELKGRVLASFHPGDRPAPGGWLHVVGGSAAQPETLWQIAEKYTGDGTNFRLLRSRNRLGDEVLVVGQEILVPAAILIEPFRGASQVVALDAGTRDLTYASDADGAYAVYELKPGEALYSSVVVRFTGRLFAADVNPLAEEIARRSGIDDVTEIPVGYQVKVPLDLLLPEYLPRDNPRRVEYEEGLSRSAQFSNSVRSRDLSGITVVLDAGHGGRDVGATSGGVWESLYVYDIMLRVRKELLARTAAKVVPTTRNGPDFAIENADVLTYSKEHEVRTTPPYPITDAKVGVGLRWYLANSVVDDAKPEQTIFLSIHADSLHPSVRGAMVYVPGLLPIPSRYGLSAAVYTQRAEVRSRPTVSFSKQERIESEGLSRDLANKIIAGFRGKKIGIHPNKPVRDRIVRRRGRPWVPAVLRYNAIPAKVLVEVCNLANEEDRRLIQTREFRQRVAEALVQGILDYYGETQGDLAP
ncbi:MAG: N-acetylmuramoyl-L-alanine amidase [Acidobacteriota bacterium]